MNRFGWLALAAVTVVAGCWLYVHGGYTLALGPRSDAARFWVLTQYVQAGRDPYPLTRTILTEECGPANALPARLFVIPEPTVPATKARVLAPLGPPEATYPPSAVGLLCVMVGWAPDRVSAQGVWLAAQAVCIGLVVWLLSGWLAPPARLSRPAHAAVLLALVLVFLPFQECVRSAQFTLFALPALLVATRRDVPTWACGLLLAVGLAKLTVGLPYVLWELARGRWRVVGLAAGVHAAAVGGLCLAVGADPLSIHRDWLFNGSYFLAGTYSVQDFVAKYKLYGTGTDTLLQLGALAVIGAVVTVGRRAGWLTANAFLGVANLVWIYHRGYDFITLLVPLLVLAGWADARPDDGVPRPPPVRVWWGRAAGVLAAVAIGVGVLSAVQSGDGPLDRPLRWACRLAVLGVLGVTGWLMVRDARRPARPTGTARVPESAAG